MAETSPTNIREGSWKVTLAREVECPGKGARARLVGQQLAKRRSRNQIDELQADYVDWSHDMPIG